ncbi:GntR family transcriptional regulator [Prolixibacter bellariivorans]|uniref:GntR family transcriptional regulator n=1 Tax=Prolixibacter bellariivorans TaxID=314319 RepID=A0A5M4B419_9BACT|nr:GntR family transcriptional regulator [Prolixibacter bellariivorans]GET34864.1 GntR family transcriptional regulator [Prolixibacter bellariivorans]
MKEKRYKQVQDFLKLQIQKGYYDVGDYLPSENELCSTFSITRTTVRKALDELTREGFIERHHGKGSIVRERRKSLGLLNVKGFSEAVGEDVSTIFLQGPHSDFWSPEIHFKISEKELSQPCIHFSRLRCVGEVPVMIEHNWMNGTCLKEFSDIDFVNGSFFKTLSQHYHIEIVGSEQELRAENAHKDSADLLKVPLGSPILHISVKFHTSNSNFNIYSELYCNTNNYPVGNSYYL